MSSSNSIDELGQVLVNFSENGAYPDQEETSAATVEDAVLPAALEILQSARQELESEIRTISRESAPDVDEWIVHAKAIQNDIQESKKLANNIARRSQEEGDRLEALQERENHAQFLQKEMEYQDQLLKAMRAIQNVNQMLNEAEDLACRFQIPEALQQLDAAGEACSKLPVYEDVRARSILQINHNELQNLIRGHFQATWNGLVRVDLDQGTLSIHQKLSHVSMDMSATLKGLQRFDDIGAAAQRLCNDIDSIFIGPRTDIHNLSSRSIQTDKQTLSLGDATGSSLESLFSELEGVIKFLNRCLPEEITSLVAFIMMPPLSQRLLDTWLDAAVPSSLDDMVDYQKALTTAENFAISLDEINWPGSSAFHDWVSSAPRIWLSKRRETVLDWTRNQISVGIGRPYEVERIEKEMVEQAEAKELSAEKSGGATNQDWNSAWGSDGEEDEAEEVSAQNGERHRRSLEEERRASAIVVPPEVLAMEEEEEDDPGDAWGWNEEDDTPAPPSQPPINKEMAPMSPGVPPKKREITLSEKYYISVMPQPLFNTIKKLYEDGALLTHPETAQIPIAPAAAGLFGLPTLVLAMYRAISPSYYSSRPGGNMYLYNDGMWLAEAFGNFTLEWSSRKDLTPRTYKMVKLEPEIKALESFSKRAYTAELTEQRLLINDLFGGTQNFFQQDVAPGKHALDESIDTVIQHVREQSRLWKGILPYSAWASAAGSLANEIATRIISDVFDLSDISADDAERIATIIARVELLDDMFMKSSMPGHSHATSHAASRDSGKDGENDVAMTARFADKWLKMAFLGMFLQSNLEGIKQLWWETEFSVHFGVDEVVDLVKVSFEQNMGVRAAIREIKNSPHPRGV